MYLFNCAHEDNINKDKSKNFVSNGIFVLPTYISYHQQNKHLLINIQLSVVTSTFHHYPTISYLTIHIQ